LISIRKKNNNFLSAAFFPAALFNSQQFMDIFYD
jgi:hypothetical protein